MTQQDTTPTSTFTVPPVVRPAPADHPILDVIAERWSPRAIDPDQPVERSKVLRLLEAARWAASSTNSQPWRYLLFDDEVPEAREQARGYLNPGNAWALRAPVLMMSVAITAFEEPHAKAGEPNRVALHDVGAASACMALQAPQEGLVLHQMGGFKVAEAKEGFGLPEHHHPIAMIAVGYPGLVATLPEKDLVREDNPRRRLPLAEIVFHGAYGTGIDA